MAKPTAINLNDTTPAAPESKANIKWQASAPRTLPDGQTIRDVSCYITPGDGGLFGDIDGGGPTSVYGGTTRIDGGGV